MILSAVIITCDDPGCTRTVAGTINGGRGPRERPEDFRLQEPLWQSTTDPASHRDVTLCPVHRRRYGQDFPVTASERRSLTPPAQRWHGTTGAK